MKKELYQEMMLPADIFTEVLLFLTPKSITTISRVNKQHYITIMSPQSKCGQYLWKQLYLKRWNEKIDSDSRSPWLIRFRNMVQRTCKQAECITIQNRAVEYASNVCNIEYTYCKLEDNELDNEERKYTQLVPVDNFDNNDLIVVQDEPHIIISRQYGRTRYNLMFSVETCNIFTFEPYTKHFEIYELIRKDYCIQPIIEFKSYELLDIEDNRAILMRLNEDEEIDDYDIKYCCDNIRSDLIIPNNRVGSNITHQFTRIYNSPCDNVIHVIVMRCMGAEKIVDFEINE
jgi:hypothetical protein